jgi:hypothetical protein
LNQSQRENSQTRTDEKSPDDAHRLEVIESNLKQIKEEHLIAPQNRRTNSGTLRPVPQSTTPVRSKLATIKSVPGLSIFHKMDNRKALSPSNERPREVRHQKTLSLKEIKPSYESLVNSVKLRQVKLIQGNDSNIVLRDRSNGSINRANFFRGQNLQTEAEEEDKKTFTEFNIYERNNMWLTAKNSKLEALYQEKAKKELDGCTFKPLTHSKYMNNSHGNVPKAPNNETLRGDLPSARGIREHSPTNRGEMGDMLSERLTARRRSISKEKKQSNSYKQLHDLKKNWAESPGGRQPYLETNRGSSEQKKFDENDINNYFSAPTRHCEPFESHDTIRIQEMISKLKSNQ